MTIVTRDRICLFGEVIGDEMVLNDAGRMVAAAWFELPHRFPGTIPDAFVVMPNHIHGILILSDGNPDEGSPAPTSDRGVTAPLGRDKPCPYEGNGKDKELSVRSLGDLVGTFKSITTHRYTQGVKDLGWMPFDGRLWQRNYYEHVVRSDADLADLRRYVEENPLRWTLDEEAPHTPRSR